MPGKRIKDLTALSGAGSANDDDVVIFDTTADTTKRISRSQLAEGMQSDVQVLTNKTLALGSNTVTGTTAQFNTALTDGDFATLAGSGVLTNKTIDSATNTLTVNYKEAQVETSNGSRTHLFTTVAALLADTGTYTTYATGQIVEAGGFRYTVAATGATDHHVITAGSVKLYVQAGDAGYEVDAFGASNTGVDTTTAIQAAWTAALADDTPIIYGPGTYLHSSKITADLRVSGTPGARRYVKLFGAGSGITKLLFSSDGFDFIGAAVAGVNNGDHRLFIERLSIEQAGGTDRTTGTAIRITDMSGLHMQDVYVTGFLRAVDLEDVLAAQFSKIKLQYAGVGVRSRVANYSRLNLTSFRDCSFAACWTNFADIEGCNVNFDTCGFEGLGLDTSGDKGDYLSRGLVFSGGPDGYYGLVVNNCYFENNKAEADIYIAATWTSGYVFKATNFNRVSSTRYSISNTVLASSSVGSEQHVEFVSCGFLSAGTYVPDAARPKISIQNTGGFNNWYLRADRQNIGLFNGVDAFNINDAAVNRAYRVPRAATGVYTPVIEGDTATPGVGTYTAQSGIYERIGDMVFFSARVGISAHTGTGTFKISLPPIAPATTGSPPEQPITLVYSGPAYTAGQIFTGYVRPPLNTTVGSGCVQLLRMNPAGTISGVVVTNATYDLWVSGSYLAVA